LKNYCVVYLEEEEEEEEVVRSEWMGCDFQMGYWELSQEDGGKCDPMSHDNNENVARKTTIEEVK